VQPNLHQKQWKAIELLVEGKTASEVCKALDINRTSLLRWRGDPVFASQLASAMAQAMAGAIERLDMVATDAVDALADVMRNSDDDAVRVKAATELLDRARWAQAAGQSVRREAQEVIDCTSWSDNQITRSLSAPEDDDET